ncbi:MAG: type VI secretion system tip protein VgrG [Gemmatimonadaceae bacterium]|nr:type VI secretion system tip protein VgrG [Gemmatimonadaceae bacterium]
MLRSSEIEQLTVTQALGAHTACVLHFTRDSATDLAVDTMLGQALAVTVEDDGGTVDVFHGVVTAGRQTHQLQHGSVFHLEARSRSCALERRRTTYFRASTLADVAQRLGASLVGAPASADPLEFVQFGETDFDFLRRLADEQGMFVRTNTPGIEVRNAFDDAGLTLVWGRDLLSVTASCESANNGVAGAAHLVQEKRDHRFRGVSKDPSWLGGAAPLTAAASRVARERRGAEGDALVEELPFRSKTLESARAHLEQLSERALGTTVCVDGEANNPRVRAGDTVTLEESEAFTLPTRGTLGVVEVTHHFDGQLYRCVFRATPWSAWTNAQRPVRATVHGPTTGMVVDNVDPQRMGRLKVRLRWHDAGESTRWLRMAMPYSGNTRGLHFLPEIGDEVLVAFELGDPERPLIIGALWNGKDAADTTDANTAKRIVTRSGNTIQFHDDDPGNERIELFSATGQTWVQLANNGGKPLLTIHSEGDIALEARNEIRLACRTLTERIGVPAAGPPSPWVAGAVPRPAAEKTTADARLPAGGRR